jgi:hypothetical protein
MRKQQPKKTKRSTTPTTNKASVGVVPPLVLARPKCRAEWFPEPELLFAQGRRSCDPQVGIPLYGPRSFGTTRHKSEIHFGFIGTRPSVAGAQEFYEWAAAGVDGDEKHTPFPGCSPSVGFRTALRINEATVELITRQESQDILAIRGQRTAFEQLLELLDNKLRLLCGRDHPLDYVVVALSEELYKKCRVADYHDKGQTVHRDLHRAFKAVAMRHKIVTQVLLDTTTRAATGDLKVRGRKIDHPSVIAWNLFTGMYFKVEGLPWGPTGLQSGTCHVGVSFFRPLGAGSTLRASVVQAFDENGEGLVLRGLPFEWDQAKQGRSPHLTAEMASDLVGMILKRYEEERHHAPERVVVHKTSRFEPAEREGFEAALRAIPFHDLVSLRPVSDVRLLRNAQYPPIRGSAFSVGDITYLYTTGYIPQLARYPHGHVPSPIQLADHVGDTSRPQLWKEILVMTKMNWNSANMAGLWPITLRFARSVGDILREVQGEPDPKYKYYM